MKRAIVFTFFAAALAASATTGAHAQTVEFRIPFQFTIQNKTLPAGTYRVSRVSYSAQTVVEVKSLDGLFSAFSSIYTADTPSPRRGQLVFTRYGNQYFLHKVLCGHLGLNVQIPRSRLEEQAQRQHAQLPPGETVVAALQIEAR